VGFVLEFGFGSRLPYTPLLTCAVKNCTNVHVWKTVVSKELRYRAIKGVDTVLLKLKYRAIKVEILLETIEK